MKRSFRICALLLALLLLFGSAEVLALESFQLVDAETTDSIADDEIVRVMVLLEGSGAAEALPQEEPGDALFASYQSRLERTHAEIQQDMEEVVPQLQVAHDFTALFSGMSVDMPYGDISELEKIDGVEEVWVVTTYESPILSETAGSDSISSSFAASIGASYMGQGTLIAMLDTGINLSHEAFQENTDILGEPLLTASSPELSAVSVSGAYVSAKIPFAYNYADQDSDVTDYNGHGSHVAGTAAGYVETDEGAITFSGAAPGAQLAIMKIFNDSSSTTTTDVYFAALQDAYLLGVDVISLSLGTACGFTYDKNLDSTLFGNIYKTLDDAGIIVCCAAGNNGSQATDNSYSSGSVLAGYTDYGTVASPSTYTGNISVANATTITEKDYYILETDDTLYGYTEPSGSEGFLALSFGDKTMEYVPVSGYGTPDDFAAVDVSGKIALVSRGTLTFSQKVQNAADAGAVGIVIYNNTSTDVIMHVSDPQIPVALVSKSTGTALSSAAQKTMYFHCDKQYLSTTAEQEIYRDSSWGTTPELTIAPALSAEGTSISSASISGSSSYVRSTGTSMATPKVAGEFAVLLSYLKDRAPSLTKLQRAATAESMAQSSAHILGSATAPISVRRQGAGLVDASAALSAAAYIETPLQELGDDPSETGVYTMTLTLKNTLLTGMTCATDRFVDVSTSDWFHTEVDSMVHIGIFNGTGTDTFSPTRELTRAEAITALYRMAGSPAATAKYTFTDIQSGSYYEDAVAWAQAAGITTGTGGNQFSPSAPLTREQLVTLLYRYLDKPAHSGDLSGYLDESAVADYAQDAWCWAVENGVVTSCSTQFLILNPAGVATRAELVVLLYRILDNLEPVSYTPEVLLYSDTAAPSNDLLINPLVSEALDCSVSYSCEGPIEFGVWTEDQSVTVTVSLTEDAKAKLREGFENGTYVEGYVCFNGGEETIHATFLSYFGDWDDAPVLEGADFRDVARAEDLIRNNADYQDFTYYDLIPMNTGANMAQLYCSNENDSTYYKHAIAKLGDNPFSTVVDYNEAHMAVTTSATDADHTYAQQILVRTRSLRNAETLTHTVRDADTGVVYYNASLNYCSKSVYRTASGSWSYSSSLYWSATDQYGTPLPSGTNVIISVSASVRGQETHEQWSFPCTVDSKTPTLEYTLEDDQLTVTAQDEQYLAALMVLDVNNKALAAEYYSDDDTGTSHSLTVDLSSVSGSVTISAIDYATNTTRATVSR